MNTKDIAMASKCKDCNEVETSNNPLRTCTTCSSSVCEDCGDWEGSCWICDVCFQAEEDDTFVTAYGEDVTDDDTNDYDDDDDDDLEEWSDDEDDLLDDED